MVMEVNHNNDLTPIIGGASKQKNISHSNIGNVFLRQFNNKVTANCNHKTSIGYCDFTRNPVDPAGGYRYWSSIKPCESREIRFSAYRSVTRG